ncbi:MAG: hypothetical protein KAS30_01495 [Candidatus Diapherotrites archaeon]|nr:hypothetical protein [Candidatus Diapherotrites archaeon]
MRYRKLDDNGDYSFGNQQADFHIDTPDGVGQAVLTRLKLWVGEWFLDTDEGTPFEQSMLGTNKMKTIAPEARKRILETEGVTGIVDDTFEVIWNEQTRNVAINARINTEFGQQEILGVL